jgi:alkylation response protein AidB-like acyl-CoA dehydrogenase
MTKIEPSTGDDYRHIGPFLRAESRFATHHMKALSEMGIMDEGTSEIQRNIIARAVLEDRG